MAQPKLDDPLEASKFANASIIAIIASLPRKTLEGYFGSIGLDCPGNKDVLAQQNRDRKYS